ncbi:MAG: hypothetical protein ACRCVA_17275 [Phreatobacter sp.]
MLGNGCDNARTIAREALEARVLTGLRDRMMTPDMAAEAMRAYAQETNRLNRERRSTAEASRHELAETAKAIAEIVGVIEQGGWHRAPSDRLTGLEKKQDGLTARLTDVPQDVPDIHPNIAESYRRRVERLTEALSHPEDALEAADAIREVIDRIVVTPGEQRGSYTVTLQGELGTILDWIDRSGKPGYKPTSDTTSSRMSVSVNGRACPGHPRLSQSKFSATQIFSDEAMRGWPGQARPRRKGRCRCIRFAAFGSNLEVRAERRRMTNQQRRSFQPDAIRL